MVNRYLIYGWGALLLLVGADELLHPSISSFIWAAVSIALGVGVIIPTYRTERGLRKNGTTALRNELITLLKAREGSITHPAMYLNRDQHLIFAAFGKGRSFMREYDLARSDEDQQKLLQAGEMVAVTGDLFTIMQAAPQIIHTQFGAMAVTDREGNTELEPNDSMGKFRSAIRFAKMVRTGVLYAGADDLKEIIAQFRDAEPIQPDGE